MYINVFLFIALIVVSTLCGFFAAAVCAAAGRSELQDENLRLLMEKSARTKKIDPGDPKYLHVGEIFARNGNSVQCHGCGAILDGSLICERCGRQNP